MEYILLQLDRQAVSYWIDCFLFPQYNDYQIWQSPQDSKGARSVPLRGFDVSGIAPPAGEKSELKHCLQLSHTQQTLLLSAQDAELQAKWVDILSKAARGETAADASASLTEHRKSQ